MTTATPEAPPAGERTGRPAVEITHDLTARPLLLASMASPATPVIYRHGGSLVTVEYPDHGAPILRPLDAAGLRTWFARHVYTFKGEQKKPAMVSVGLSRSLLDLDASEARLLPELTGTELWPLVRPDGTVQAARGYDPATGVLVAPVAAVPTVPDQPTAADVDKARLTVLRLFASFPFKAESDRAAAIGMYLSPLIRRYLPEDARVPLHLLTATAPGSGKSLLGYYGLEVLYGALSLDAEQSGRELGKTLVAALEKDPSRGVITMDNWPTGGRVESAMMARLVTESHISGRVIGTGRTPSIPNRYLFSISGNQLRIGGDLGRRAQIIRFESSADDPATVRHDFDFGEELRATRGEVLWALLVLVRAWTAQPADSRPERKIQNAQFSAWCTVVASILDNAGIQGFWEDRDMVMAAYDERRQDFSRFYRMVRERFAEKLSAGGWLTASQIVGDRDCQELIPRTEGNFRDVGHRELGRRVLRPEAGRVYEGLTVVERWDSDVKRWMYRIVDVVEERARRAAVTARSRARSLLDRARRRVIVEKARRAHRRFTPPVPAPTPDPAPAPVALDAALWQSAAAAAAPMLT